MEMVCAKKMVGQTTIDRENESENMDNKMAKPIIKARKT